MKSTHVVVVGVDGSEPSREALRYAITEASRRGALLRVVTAYAPPELWPFTYGAEPPSDSELPQQIRAHIQRLVDEELAEEPAPPPVDLVVLRGSAAAALLNAAREADLLVVGHRGRGGFASVLLGSVGLQCVLHADCPVTVVRPTRAERVQSEKRAGAPASATR